MDERDIARRALACLDLTNLDTGCDDLAVAELCRQAVTPHGPVAAVCIWPDFVADAKQALANTPVRVATVVNFPDGAASMEEVRTEARTAIVDGADEVDLVVPWRRVAAGHADEVAATVREIKEICGSATLKAILETGEIADRAKIRRAADEALAGGADFLKTSTGTTEVSATPEAAAILLEAIRDSGLAAGMKPAGGIRTVADAGRYLELCDEVMGPDWATPARFRIGASGLLAALLATLDGVETAVNSEAY